MTNRRLTCIVTGWCILVSTACHDKNKCQAPAPSIQERYGWSMTGFDSSASGHNPYERRLGRDTVARLEVEWVFDTARAGRPVRPIHATPVIDAEGNTYVGDFAGTFFAIDNTGGLRWSFTADPPTPELGALFPPELGPPNASPFIGGAALAVSLPYVVAGDANGRIYARDRTTGAEVWTRRGLNPNPLGGVAGNSITIVGDTVLVGMSSLENFAFVLTSGGVPVQCCSHRGALVALDLATGAERWRYNVVEEAQPLPSSAAPFVLGPSGGDVWSQPSHDPETDTVYISTGQNLSPTPQGTSTPGSDAIIALEFRTGQPKWVRQLTEGDIWAIGVPNPHPATGQLLDMDLGDAPKVYRLPDGQKVVGAGQKDGRYHILDAQTGAVVRTTSQLPPRNDLGGFQTGGAVADRFVYQHGLGATEGFSTCNEGPCVYEGYEGRVLGLTPDGSEVRWSVSIPGSPLVGGLAVANGLVYFQSPVEEAEPLMDARQWGLYAVDTDSGAVLRRLIFPGRAVASPVVADGHVYATSGNAALGAFGFEQEGAVTRLGVSDCANGDD